LTACRIEYFRAVARDLDLDHGDARRLVLN
jgi:hypothetical protein